MGFTIERSNQAKKLAQNTTFKMYYDQSPPTSREIMESVADTEWVAEMAPTLAGTRAEYSTICWRTYEKIFIPIKEFFVVV